MRRRKIWQRELFEEGEAFQLPPQPLTVRQDLSRLLAKWMQELATAINEETGDDQDQR